MWTETTHAIAAIAGTVIATGGLFAVVHQLRHLGEDLRGNARTSIYALGSNLKNVFIEYPHLRRYFLDNEAIESDHPDYERVTAIADLYCLYLEQIGTQSRNVARANRIAWHRYVADIYHSSPVIREQLERRTHWYSVELQQAVRVSRAVDPDGQASNERPSVDVPAGDSATPRSATQDPST